MRKHNGYSLAELLTVVAIIALIALATVPAFASMRRRSAARTAAVAMRSIFHLARSRAVSRGRNCGVKFQQSGPEWQFALYDDGDGDGVRNDDITKGTDRRVAPPRVVLPESRLVSIGLLPDTVRDPDGDQLLPTASPVQFGRSTICSFSPLGESTPGTIYMKSDRNLWAVRVYGATAKMRVLRYDVATRKWVER